MKLEGSGVQAFIPDESLVAMNWALINAIGGVRLQVAEADKKRAIEILQITPSDQGIVQCPRCDSTNVAFGKTNWYSGFLFALALLIPIPGRKLLCLDCEQKFEYKK